MRALRPGCPADNTPWIDEGSCSVNTGEVWYTGRTYDIVQQIVYHVWRHDLSERLPADNYDSRADFPTYNEKWQGQIRRLMTEDVGCEQCTENFHTLFPVWIIDVVFLTFGIVNIFGKQFYINLFCTELHKEYIMRWSCSKMFLGYQIRCLFLFIIVY